MAWSFMYEYTLWLNFIGYWTTKVNSLAAPISWTPSQTWDGNDGPWSSFNIQIGNPPQNLRLLPSTSCNSISPILVGGCPRQAPKDCLRQRAAFFQPNLSLTWHSLGIYELPLNQETPLGYQVNGSFGIDDVILSNPGDLEIRSLQDQVIGGFIDDSIDVGILGLNPQAINLTNLTNPRTSFLGSLVNESKIPSTTWAYTAGAKYREPIAFGSLTLGGYDAERAASSNISIPFSADSSRALIVGLQTISTNIRNTKLMSSGIFVLLDSLTPDIWLPLKVCQAFEKVFDLEFNETSQRYFINATHHDNLKALNPNITLILGSESRGGPTIDITMQYGSFDLQYEDPRTGHKSQYFPLRRAFNSYMYTLGRAFFQDAYVIADYDRSTFTIQQASFPNSTHAQRIISILPPDHMLPVETSANSDSGLQLSGKIGIAIGGVVCLISIGVLWSMVVVRKRRKKKKSNKSIDSLLHFQKPELDTNGTSKVEAPNDVGVDKIMPELHDMEKGREVFRSTGTVAIELGNDMHEIAAELPGSSSFTVEKERNAAP